MRIRFILSALLLPLFAMGQFTIDFEETNGGDTTHCPWNRVDNNWGFQLRRSTVDVTNPSRLTTILPEAVLSF